MKTAVVALALLATPAFAQNGPNVDVWVENGSNLRRGEIAEIHYFTDPGSYLTIVRFNTDGEMTILVPRLPNSRSKISSSAERMITFSADAAPGIGQIFAIASRTPFNFAAYRDRQGRWLPASAASRRSEVDDVVMRFAEQVSRHGNYSMAGAEYRVSDGRKVVVVMPPYDDYGYNSYDGYDDWYDSRYWGMSGRGSYYWNGYGYAYPLIPLTSDPRRHAYKHCADGSLIPWTAACPLYRTPSRPTHVGRLRPLRPTPPRQPRMPAPPIIRRAPASLRPQVPPAPSTTTVTPPAARPTPPPAPVAAPRATRAAPQAPRSEAPPPPAPTRERHPRKT